MVHSETVFDADWSDEDVAAALAWQDNEDAKCSGCGHPRDESMDPERALAYDAEPVVCHSCAARARADRAFRSANGDNDGVLWRIIERKEVSG